MTKVKMKAKFASTCNACSQPIDEGSEIYYLPDFKKAQHLTCPKKTASSPKAKKVKKPADILMPNLSYLPDNWQEIARLLKPFHFEEYTEEQFIKLMKSLQIGEPPF